VITPRSSTSVGMHTQAPTYNTVILRISRLIGERYFEWYHRIECTGAENVPLTGPLLVVANHASNLDPFALSYGMRRPVSFLAKRELFGIPVVGFLLRQWGCFPIDREEADISAARTCLAILRAGLALGLFPEGTRTRDGRLQPFKIGVAKIAVRARAPVLPVGLLGTFEALPRGALFPKPVKIRVRYGVPFELTEYYERRMTDEDAAEATRRIREAVAELLR
jgi:1-acyl-sn-glycerol-3-phosphate acyltransferase